MAKTLRVRTRTGWVTKPVADTPENRLTAQEVDDNFLAVEDAIEAKKSFEVGHVLLAARDVSMPGWIPMDGKEYANTEYPDLGAVLNGVYTFNELVPGVPSRNTRITGLDHSPDDAYLAISSLNSPYYEVLETATWTSVSGLPAIAAYGQDVAFSPDGAYLAVAHRTDPNLLILETATWTAVAGTPTIAGDVEKVQWSDDGTLLAMTHAGTPYFTVLNVSDWSVVPGTPVLPNIGEGLRFSNSGEHIAIGHSGTPYLTVARVRDWGVVSGTPILDGRAYALAWNADDSVLAVGHEFSGSFAAFRTDNWTEILGVTSNGTGGRNLEYTEDGLYLIELHQQFDGLTVHDAKTWLTLGGTYSSFDGTMYGLSLSHDGKYLALGTNSSTSSLYYLYTQSQTQFKVQKMIAPNAALEWRIKAADV